MVQACLGLAQALRICTDGVQIRVEASSVVEKRSITLLRRRCRMHKAEARQNGLSLSAIGAARVGKNTKIRDFVCVWLAATHTRTRDVVERHAAADDPDNELLVRMRTGCGAGATRQGLARIRGLSEQADCNELKALGFDCRIDFWRNPSN